MLQAPLESIGEEGWNGDEITLTALAGSRGIC